MPHDAPTDPVSTDERPSRRRARDEEGGFALVYFALVLTVLMAMAGLGLDMWNLWRTSNEVQRAADAGALGGVTFLPTNLAQARTTAFDMVEANGYPRAQATAGLGTANNRLQVSVTTSVSNTFMRLFGVGTTSITRKAVAEFSGPVPMGSPDNNLANDPDLNALTDHWMNIASVRNSAGNGDRYQAGLCPGNTSLGVCPTGTITNPSYSADGHFYAVEVDAGTTGTLNIQVFDPAFYELGDTCTQDSGNGTDPDLFNVNLGALNTTASSEPAGFSIPNNWYSGGTGSPNANERYVAGNNRRWCSGDWQAGSTPGGNGPITTSYIVRQPDATPFVDTDNPLVTAATCAPRQFTGRDLAWMENGTNGLQGRLASGAESNVGPTTSTGVTNATGSAWTQTLANSFRRWVTVCSIPNPVAGRYILQVRTNAAVGSPTVTSNTVDTWGHNRYALRVGIGTNPSAASFDDGVRIFANGRLPIYTNADGADTEFFLARILPSGSNRILRVTLWDISDAGSAGSMQVVPPTENGLGATFANCSFNASGGTFTNEGGCEFSFAQNAMNAQLMTVNVPIPSTYTCTQADPLGCWIKVKAPFDGAVTDTTTWSAEVIGDPVRLVE